MGNINHTIFDNDMKISNWTTQMAEKIYKILENPNWASWLEANIHSIEGRAKVFPEGQFLLSNGNEMLASLSTNQIDWDGNKDSLPTWDEVAGDPTTYENTYKKDGNTLVLMSMNVNKTHKGQRLTDYLVSAAKDLAKKNNINHIIGSFRPSGYGKYKMLNGYIKFEDYLELKNEDGFSIDPWIRSLQKKGMTSIKIDENAMNVEITYDDFLKLKKDNWFETSKGVWECGEVGQFEIISDSKVLYTEKNIWGEIPLNN